MNYLKLVTFNLINAIGLFLFAELVITLVHFVPGATQSALTCKSALTFYDYCPGVTQVRFMHAKDRLFPVYNHIGQDRRSAYADPSTKPAATQSRRIFLIGDSFIQADELSIEDRIEHHFRKQGYETSAFGYSSWNTHQFTRIAGSLDVNPGDVVFVFSMTNDFTPVYARSTQRTDTTEVVDEFRPDPTHSWWEAYLEQSFMYQRMGNLFDSSAPKSNDIQKPFVTESHDSKNSLDCDSIPPLEELASELAHNYIELSKASHCWSKETRESVELNVVMLKDMVTSLEQKGVQTRIVLVPAGWAFKQQNTAGRQAGIYRFSPDVRIDHSGLFQFMSQQGLPMIDPIPALESESQARDDLYFPVDGHWTARSHKIMFRTLHAVMEPGDAD